MTRREIESKLLASLCGSEDGGGLEGDIRRLLWVGVHVRERFSLDNWHALNRLQHQLQAYVKTKPTLSESLMFLDQMLLAASALAGFAMDDMTRDDGWRFLINGRRIERLCFLSGAISQFLRLDATRHASSLEWLLELADSSITYRSRYMALPELLPTIDLIVFDEDNPHAVIFQVINLVRYLGRLERELGEGSNETGKDGLRIALSRLRTFEHRCDSRDKAEGDDGCNCLELADLLDEIGEEASRLSDRLAMRYFTHVSDVGQQTLAA